MLQITPHMKILLAVEPVDFRRGIDGLARACREVLHSDPFSGYLFVFRNRRGTSVKILCYDTQGFCLLQKRLSKGRFNWWPVHGNDGKRVLKTHQLQLLLWNGDPEKGNVAPEWKAISTAE